MANYDQNMEDEKIYIKPPIDIIPDEYLCFENPSAKVLVHNFCTSHELSQRNGRTFKDCLEEKHFEITEHNLQKDNCLETLGNIRDECKHDDDDVAGLVLFFCGSCTESGHFLMNNGKSYTKVDIHRIYGEFYSSECPGLKNKPKIFIFEVQIKAAVETDYSKEVSSRYQLTYDTPNEADILIIFHVAKDIEKEDYIIRFCENIKQFGKSEDITSLATCVEKTTNVPMLISTLTRKFYFKHSDFRGFHYMTNELHTSITQVIKSKKTLRSGIKRNDSVSSRSSSSSNVTRQGTNFGNSRLSQSSKDVTKITDRKSTTIISTVVESDSKTTIAKVKGPIHTKQTDVARKISRTEEGESSGNRKNSTTTIRFRTKSTTSVDGSHLSERPKWKY